MTILKAYEKLGVSSSTSREDVKRCYAKKVKQFHPDKNHLLVEGRDDHIRKLCEAEVMEINAAWKCIRDLIAYKENKQAHIAY